MADGPPKARMTVSTTDRAKAGEDSSFSADNHSHATISISRDCVEQLNTAEGPSPFELAPSETPSNDSRRGQTHISGTRHTEACPRRSGPGLRTPRRALLTAKRPELQPWIASTRWRRAATTSASNAPETSPVADSLAARPSSSRPALLMLAGPVDLDTPSSTKQPPR
jgi:hypothetical protein